LKPHTSRSSIDKDKYYYYYYYFDSLMIHLVADVFENEAGIGSFD
jgi:hypothetical protein